MSRFIPPYADVGKGITPSDGAKLSFFETNSSTPKNTYSDEALTIANTNPVIADSNGLFGDIWLESGQYKVQLKNKNDTQIWEADPVNSINTAVFIRVDGTVVVFNYDSLNDAVISVGLVVDQSLNIKERVVLNGGGAMWDVVLSSSVTENTFNIVQCTGVPSLSLVLREINPVFLPTLGVQGVNDNALIQAAFDTGAKVVDIGGTGSLSLSATRVIPAGVELTTSGAAISVSGNTTIFNLSQGSKVTGINFTGTGIASGNTLEIPVRISGIGLCEVSGNTFDQIGGTATLIRQYYTEHDGSRIVDNTYTFNNVGINLEERGEYVTVGQNTINNNTTGIIVQGGNNRVVNNTITDNAMGILVEVGTNDAHGNIDSNSINHNIINVQVNAINVEEMSFDSNSIYVGKIILNGCTGVTFTGGLIESSSLIEEKGALECEFRNVKFPGNINNTPNDGTPSKVLYKNCVLDRSSSITASTSINGAYSEVSRSGLTTLAASLATQSIFNVQQFNSITSNTSFTVEQLYDTSAFTWSPTTAIVERGFTISLNAQLSISRTGADVDIANIHAMIVDAANSNIIYGVLSASPQNILSGDVRTHTFAFNGQIPRKDFRFKLLNESIDTIQILSDQPDARSKVIVTGW